MAKIIIPISVLEDISDKIKIKLTSFDFSSREVLFNWSASCSTNDPDIEYNIDITDDVIIETEDFVEREVLKEAQQRILELEQTVEDLKVKLATKSSILNTVNKWFKWSESKMKFLKTVEDVREYMININPNNDGNPIDDEKLCWFNCVYQAKYMGDFNVKYTANMLYDGIVPQNTLKELQSTLDTVWDDINNPRALENLQLCEQIALFIGNDKEVQLLKELISYLEDEDKE